MKQHVSQFAVALLVVCMVLLGLAEGQTTQQIITFQGRLTNADGSPIDTTGQSGLRMEARVWHPPQPGSMAACMALRVCESFSPPF